MRLRVEGKSERAGPRALRGLCADGVCRPGRGLETVEFATLEWVHRYNHRRLLGPIGYIPPAQKEAHYFNQRLGPAIAV